MYKKFVELLQKNKVTPYQVAKDTGISQMVFTRWKQGKCKPKLEKLMKIAEYFGVDLRYFVDEI